jgi:ferredoxin-NADP reductase
MLDVVEEPTPTPQPAAPHEAGHVIEHPAEFDVTVTLATSESEGVRSYVLRRADGGRLPGWEPGAHVDVLLDGGLERQYSLCGDPTDPDWRIAVLLEPESRGGSSWIHANLAAGSQVRVRGPRNNFPLTGAAGYLMIAGGIGITPLLPMIRDLAARGADWKLLYGGRERISMAFVSELESYGDRVLIRPQDEFGLLDLAGWIGEPRADVAIYCCGPEPLLQAVEQRHQGWPAGTLHLERFKPRPGALDGEQTAFEVELSFSGITIQVGADQTIAEAVEAAGIEIETSCREGTCGTCETVVIEGIPDHRDSFLQEDERAANETMMICCSRARTPRLVLDL